MARADHVLVVDDDRDIRDLVKRYLEKNGVRASVAANGRQMRSLLDAADVDLVVLDLMLPGAKTASRCAAICAQTASRVRRY